MKLHNYERFFNKQTLRTIASGCGQPGELVLVHRYRTLLGFGSRLLNCGGSPVPVHQQLLVLANCCFGAPARCTLALTRDLAVSLCATHGGTELHKRTRPW